LYGGFAGVQKQWGNWVLGLEASFDGADITGTSTSTVVRSFYDECDGDCFSKSRTASITSKIDELGYVGGKVGWAFSPNWLIYGTGGMAFAHVEDTVTASTTFTYLDCSSDCSYTTALSPSGGESIFGWAAGAGLDWKWQIDPGSAVILGVEYLHYQFDTNSIALPDQFGLGFTGGLNTKESVDTIKGRISWLFSIH
jgi:outer membrane immunogenic protein